MKYLSYILIPFVLYGCASTPVAPQAPPPSLPVLTIKADTVTTFQIYPAAIEGTDEVEIRPQVNGTLDKVFVDEGAYVQAGQPLFQINEQPFQAALNNAIASLHAAEGASANAELEVEKLTPLVQNKVISDYQLQTAKTAAQVAKANIEEAKANIRTAEINLGYCLIKAPVNGFVGRLLRKKGSLVGPADPTALTGLSDVHQVHVYFSLSENDFAQFKQSYPGATLAEKLRHLPPVSLLLSDNTVYPVSGRVDIVDGRFDKNTAAITLRAVFANPSGILRAGNTGKIRLPLRHDNIIAIPKAATMDLQDKTYVYLVGDSNKVKKVQIAVVGHDDNDYLIGSGLKSGDRLLVDGILTVQEGQVVNPAPDSNKVAIQKK